MDKAELKKFRHDLGVFAQSLAYYMFTTAGVIAMAVSLLAGPVIRYYQDDRAIEIQEYKITKLEQQRDQQAELLGRMDNEAIVKRAAQATLNYVTSKDDLLTQGLDSKPHKWPEITDLVLRACSDFPEEKRKPIWYDYCVNLAEKKNERTALFCIGGGLIAVCLTCFGTTRKC